MNDGKDGVTDSEEEDEEEDEEEEEEEEEEDAMDAVMANAMERNATGGGGDESLPMDIANDG